MARSSRAISRDFQVAGDMLAAEPRLFAAAAAFGAGGASARACARASRGGSFSGGRSRSTRCGSGGRGRFSGRARGRSTATSATSTGVMSTGGSRSSGGAAMSGGGRSGVSQLLDDRLRQLGRAVGRLEHLLLIDDVGRDLGLLRLRGRGRPGASSIITAAGAAGLARDDRRRAQHPGGERRVRGEARRRRPIAQSARSAPVTRVRGGDGGGHGAGSAGGSSRPTSATFR